jgi:predicted phage terminase large subunit-like protein
MPVLATYTRAKFRTREISTPPPQQVSDRAIAARRDLGEFGAYVAGKIPAPHHRAWFPLLCSDEQYVSILAPRGSAKSTWLALYAAWMIGKHPELQIIYVGYAEPVALKQSRVIKRIIESPRYQEVFPHIRPGKRWSDTDWEIDKNHAGVSALDSDYTFYAVGVTGSITSRRAGLILYDDLIKSSAAIANEEIREKMTTNIDEVIMPTLIPGGWVRNIGTRFRRDDLHAKKFTAENGWNVIEQSAIADDCSYWPDRFTLEFLQGLQEANPITFAYQYQNQIPPDQDEAIIRAEWIQYGVVPNQFDDLVMGVDLAASERQKGDYTALVLIGRAGDTYYVVDAIRERISGNLEKIRRICELRKKYGQFRVIVERVAYQASFAGDWRDEMKRRRLSWRCEEFIPKGDKDQRLEGISGVFANGLVVLNRDRPMNQLVSELLRTTLEHDDLADATVIALSRLQRKSSRAPSFA